MWSPAQPCRLLQGVQGFFTGLLKEHERTHATLSGYCHMYPPWKFPIFVLSANIYGPCLAQKAANSLQSLS